MASTMDDGAEALVILPQGKRVNGFGATRLAVPHLGADDFAAPSTVRRTLGFLQHLPVRPDISDLGKAPSGK